MVEKKLGEGNLQISEVDKARDIVIEQAEAEAIQLIKEELGKIDITERETPEITKERMSPVKLKKLSSREDGKINIGFDDPAAMFRFLAERPKIAALLTTVATTSAGAVAILQKFSPDTIRKLMEIGYKIVGMSPGGPN